MWDNISEGKRGKRRRRSPPVGASERTGSLTVSLVASFSGVWGGSLAAGLLDGMAEGSSVKHSTDSGKRGQSQHGRGPQMPQVQLLSPPVTPSVIRCSLALSTPPFPVQDRQNTHTHTQQRQSEFTLRTEVTQRNGFQFSRSRRRKKHQ